MSIKILVQPYNNYLQNPAGGVQTRVCDYINSMSELDCQIEIFDKTKHKLQDWDIIHFFKLSVEHYDLMKYAKSKGLKIALSSIVPLNNGIKIRTHRFLCKFIPLNTIIEMNGKMLESSDVILTQSMAEAEFIRKNYSIYKTPFEAIPNGLSPTILNGDPSLAKSIYGDKPFVLIVGRIDSNKNQLNVIRALKGLDIPLLIVGGPDPGDLDYFNKCQQEAGKNVSFTGWIPKSSPMLASIFAAAKVVILPSFHETFGNAIIEGAVTDNNLVYSNTLAISEYRLNKGVWTINPLDIKQIRSRIIEAYDTPINSELKKYILQNFTWDAIAKKHLDIFTNLIKNDGSL